MILATGSVNVCAHNFRGLQERKATALFRESSNIRPSVMGTKQAFKFDEFSISVGRKSPPFKTE